MEKINKKQSSTINKKQNKDLNKNGFYKVVCNRAYIVGESKNSVLFGGYGKQDNTYLTWLPKKLVFKNEYALMVTISIPKSWDNYSFSDINGNEYTSKDIEEYKSIFKWKTKTRFGGTNEEDEE